MNTAKGDFTLPPRHFQLTPPLATQTKAEHNGISETLSALDNH